jgi:hypothetical protein
MKKLQTKTKSVFVSLSQLDRVVGGRNPQTGETIQILTTTTIVFREPTGGSSAGGGAGSSW